MERIKAVFKNVWNAFWGDIQTSKFRVNIWFVMGCAILLALPTSFFFSIVEARPAFVISWDLIPTSLIVVIIPFLCGLFGECEWGEGYQYSIRSLTFGTWKVGDTVIGRPKFTWLPRRINTAPFVWRWVWVAWSFSKTMKLR